MYLNPCISKLNLITRQPVCVVLQRLFLTLSLSDMACAGLQNTYHQFENARL